MSEISNIELSKALKLALGVLIKEGKELSNYKITKAENLLPKGPAVWLITFKNKRLIPKDKSGIIGAGDEIFVTVELDSNSAKISGYGE